MSRALPRAVVGATALAALVLAGCSGDGDAEREATEAGTIEAGETEDSDATAEPTEAGPDPSATGEPEFTFGEADTAFLTSTLPSHDQAIEVAQLVLERTERDDFRQLATDTIEFREAQTATLVELAEAADLAIDPSDHAVDAPGVVPDEDIAALADAEAFDVAAAEVLARIDEGAVTASDEALASVEHPDVVVVAIDGIDRFEAEAQTLRTWIEQWGG